MTMDPQVVRGRLVAKLSELLAWGQKDGRAFPWRSTSGYPLAVAEVLLQKTRGPAVAPVWESLIGAYPEPEALAHARVRSIEKIVAPLGLGKQRAARLSAMARAWSDGVEPLPGLGPYGAGVLALAGGCLGPVPVDGNIARVITRLFGLKFERGEPRKKREVIVQVQELIEAADTTDRLPLVYALVDLGAVRCKPRNPECGECPLAGACAFASEESV